jgi:hypothetical protein
MREKTETQKLIERLEKMKDDSENWSEDQCRSFDEELLPELEGLVDEMEGVMQDRLTEQAEDSE